MCACRLLRARRRRCERTLWRWVWENRCVFFLVSTPPPDYRHTIFIIKPIFRRPRYPRRRRFALTGATRDVSAPRLNVENSTRRSSKYSFETAKTRAKYSGRRQTNTDHSRMSIVRGRVRVNVKTNNTKKLRLKTRPNRLPSGWAVWNWSLPRESLDTLRLHCKYNCTCVRTGATRYL